MTSVLHILCVYFMLLGAWEFNRTMSHCGVTYSYKVTVRISTLGCMLAFIVLNCECLMSKFTNFGSLKIHYVFYSFMPSFIVTPSFSFITSGQVTQAYLLFSSLFSLPKYKLGCNHSVCPELFSTASFPFKINCCFESFGLVSPCCLKFLECEELLFASQIFILVFGEILLQVYVLHQTFVF